MDETFLYVNVILFINIIINNIYRIIPPENHVKFETLNDYVSFIYSKIVLNIVIVNVLEEFLVRDLTVAVCKDFYDFTDNYMLIMTSILSTLMMIFTDILMNNYHSIGKLFVKTLFTFMMSSLYYMTTPFLSKCLYHIYVSLILVLTEYQFIFSQVKITEIRKVPNTSTSLTRNKIKSDLIIRIKNEDPTLDFDTLYKQFEIIRKELYDVPTGTTPNLLILKTLIAEMKDDIPIIKNQLVQLIKLYTIFSNIISFDNNIVHIKNDSIDVQIDLKEMSTKITTYIHISTDVLFENMEEYFKIITEINDELLCELFNSNLN